MPDVALVDFLVLALAFLAFSFLYSCGTQKKLPFPPGPKRLPVVGNLFDMPDSAEWITYKRWGKLYGGLLLRNLSVHPPPHALFWHAGSDVLHVDVLGTHIVVINTVKAANELLEKRSSVYSDR